MYVSDDGKWFFDGDTLTNPNPKPVTSAADLSWMESRSANIYRTRARRRRWRRSGTPRA